MTEGSNLYYTNARADARIAAADINDLNNVNTTGKNSNSVLKYNGSNWVVEDINEFVEKVQMATWSLLILKLDFQ